MIDDNLSLQDVYVYEFMKIDDNQMGQYEFSDYYCSKKELTHEQIIYQMVRKDLGRWDVVIVHKALVLDFDK